MALYIIFACIALWFFITLLSKKSTERIPKAFAGKHTGEEPVVELPKNRNRTLYFDGEKQVDLSEYRKFIISGNSLEPLGLKDSTIVYAKPAESTISTASVRNKYLIFKYDIDRIAIEHPEYQEIDDNSFKARFGVMTISTNLAEDEFKETLRALVECDGDIPADNKARFLDSLWKKYQRANSFYKGDPLLIVSQTYRGGNEKDYSFYSPEYLEGIVQYQND